MAKKRPEFSFPELDGRGRNAILRSSAEVQAEEALLVESEATPVPQVTAPTSAQAGQPERATTPAEPAPADQQAEPEPTSVHTSVRARTRAPRANPAAVVTDRLRQKLRTKQHLSSYTFRFRPEELEQLDQLVAELNQSRTSKLSKNDLVRLALGWLLTDYEEYGPASLVVEVTRQE